MSEPSTVPYALVVDDDAVILTDAEQILEQAGFRTLTAMNADEALVLLERKADAVTVLFTDVEMPGARNGFDLARETAQRWPQIGILIASGRVEPAPGDVPEGAHFIRKPFSVELVHGRLQELLPEGRKPPALKRAIWSGKALFVAPHPLRARGSLDGACARLHDLPTYRW